MLLVCLTTFITYGLNFMHNRVTICGNFRNVIAVNGKGLLYAQPYKANSECHYSMSFSSTHINTDWLASIFWGDNGFVIACTSHIQKMVISDSNYQYMPIPYRTVSECKVEYLLC